MTQAQYCWIEVGAVVPGPEGPAGPAGPPGAGRDTLFGHGTAYGTNLSPVDGEAQFDRVSGQAQSYDGTGWVDHVAQEGDEYVDLDTGITYSLTVLGAQTASAGPQRTFVVSEPDFLAGILPAGSRTGDVVLSSTGGRARII